MFTKHSVEIDWGGRPLKLETGKIARQADGKPLRMVGVGLDTVKQIDAQLQQRHYEGLLR